MAGYYFLVAMKVYRSALALTLILVLIQCNSAVELTFELPDNAKECFFEEIEVGTDFTIEFQVLYSLAYSLVSSF